jgi:hypothetical protein
LVNTAVTAQHALILFSPGQGGIGIDMTKLTARFMDEQPGGGRIPGLQIVVQVAIETAGGYPGQGQRRRAKGAYRLYLVGKAGQAVQDRLAPLFVVAPVEADDCLAEIGDGADLEGTAV